jgi:glycosyltransferase involved in cell wall biosynthesis
MLPQQQENPARIALICQHFYPEMISTGLFMTELASGLSAQGWRLRVYCSQPVYRDESQSETKVPRRMEHKGVEIIRIPSLGNPRASLIQRAINAISYLLSTSWHLVRDRKDLRGIVNTTNPPFLGLAALIGKFAAGLVYVTIVHDVFPDLAICLGLVKPDSLIASLWDRATRVILNSSDGVVVIGRDMEQLVRRKLNRVDQVEVALIPNWSDAEFVHPVPREENEFARRHNLLGRFVVQYSGRMGRTHNIEPLLEAAKLLQEEPVAFQLIGDGAKRKHLEIVTEELGLRNVQFLPYQPSRELAQVLSAPDLAAVCLDRQCTGASVPSKTYGIMASGRPILALLDPCSEIGRLIREEECGVVVPNPTGEQVAQVIRGLVAAPERVEQMGRRGREAFLKNYTLALAVRRYDEFLTRHFGSLRGAGSTTEHAQLSNSPRKSVVKLPALGRLSTDQSGINPQRGDVSSHDASNRMGHGQ